MRTVRFMFAEENRGKEIKERIQKDLKQYKKAVILTGMILGTMQLLFQTVCPMRILFGIPCPGCGLTHAGWYVITFQWKKAWQWNPTIFLWIFCMGSWCFFRYVKAQQSKFFSIILVITCGATFLRYGWKYKEEITRGFLWMQWYMKKSKQFIYFIKCTRDEGGNVL